MPARFLSAPKAAVRKYLIDENTMLAAGNCQTSQAMAICYNIFSPQSAGGV